MPKGNAPRPGAKKLKTTKNPDGSQQYIRGRTPTERFVVVSDAANAASNMGERLFYKNKIAASNKAYDGADMLYKARKEENKKEAKKETARRAGKLMAGRKTLKK